MGRRYVFRPLIIQNHPLHVIREKLFHLDIPEAEYGRRLSSRKIAHRGHKLERGIASRNESRKI